MLQNRNTKEWNAALQELGFRPEETAQIIKLLESGQADQAVLLLRRRKKVLLDGLHSSEKKIDLLDFLLYQLKKQAAAPAQPAHLMERMELRNERDELHRKTDIDRRMG